MNFSKKISLRYVLSPAALLVMCFQAPLLRATAVTNCADSGAGSLRAAIATATATAGDGIVTFNLSCTTSLLSTISLSGTVTIDGAGQTVTISGGHSIQVFNISGSTGVGTAAFSPVQSLAEGAGREAAAFSSPQPHATTVGGAAPNVTLMNLTIANGSNGGGSGGGVSNASNLTITNVTFTGNSAAGFGGAIYNGGTITTVANSSFTGNVAIESGGAIYNAGTITTLANTTFTGNSSGGGNSGGDGGAIYNSATISNLFGCSFANNLSTNDGGAMKNAGDASVATTTFSNNTANGIGGAISDNGTLHILQSTFSGNRSTQSSAGFSDGGGAIYDSGSLTVTASTFSGNTASGVGGAIEEKQTGFILNSTFTSNSSSQQGGAIYNDGSTFTFFVTLSANTAPAGGGGNIYNNGATVDLENTMIAGSDSTGGNCASNGGVIIGNYDLDSGTSCGLTGTSLRNMNPQLGSLANNTGPTQTEALASTSPAIDRIPPGTNFCPPAPPATPPASAITADQRGITRPQGAGCDIGAYELIPVTSSHDEIKGKVTDSSHNPVPGAPVQVCPSAGGSCAFTAFADGSGNYDATGLPDGSYLISAFPPTGSVLLPGATAASVNSVNTPQTANVQLGAPTPPPAGTGFLPNNGAGGGGVQVIYWGNPTTLSTTGCPHGSANYKVVMASGVTASSGAMTEGPAGSGHYSASVPAFFPNFHGNATVTVSISCPGSLTPTVIIFPLYIDPSGVVQDQNGHAIHNATVTLLNAPTAGGPFAQVPNGSGVMDPANRKNPDTTNSLGQYGWEVVAGFYQITATAPGCSQTVSPILTIPPAVTGLTLTLNCPTVKLTTSVCNGTYTGAFNGSLTVPSGQACQVNGGSIGGNVTVNSGGTLTLSNTQVYGTIIAATGSSVNVTGGAINSQGDNFSIFATAPAAVNLTGTVTNGTVEATGGDVDIARTHIYGSLVTQGAHSVLLTSGSIVEQNAEMFATAGVPAGLAANYLCNIRVGGTLELVNSANTAPFGVGDRCFLLPANPQLTVNLSGSVVVQGNAAEVTLNGNYIGQNLVCTGNTPAPASAEKNTVGGAKTGQCSTGF